MRNTFLLLAILGWAGAGYSGEIKGRWTLEKSEISYTVTHPLHVVHGKSLSARGKGVCYSDHCEFLVGIPVKSFDSGDHNRDAHMWEVTQAGLYPLIQVRIKTGEIKGEKSPKQVLADMEIQFNGHTNKYLKVPLDILEWKSGEVHISGTIPLTLKDFSIEPPSLLTMPIANDVPVKLDAVWKRDGSK